MTPEDDKPEEVEITETDKDILKKITDESLGEAMEKMETEKFQEALLEHFAESSKLKNEINILDEKGCACGGNIVERVYQVEESIHEGRDIMHIPFGDMRQCIKTKTEGPYCIKCGALFLRRIVQCNIDAAEYPDDRE